MKSILLTLIIVLPCLIANSQPSTSTNDKKPGETVYRETKKEFLNLSRNMVHLLQQTMYECAI